MSKKNWCGKEMGKCCSGGGIYFLGLIGSAIYYIQTAGTFGQGVVGILKALVWPVFAIYHLLGL